MRTTPQTLLSFVTWLLASHAQAQTYSIDWFTVASGGGVSSGGRYELDSTLGQPDISEVNGGRYALAGDR